MSSFPRALANWLVEAYHNMAELVIVNLLWFLLTIPVVTAPPAAAGLYYATNQVAYEKTINWRTFFEGFRTHFWMSWRWALMVVLGTVLILSNIWFYRGFEAQWSVWLQSFFMGLLVLWGLLNLYTFPLLLEQSDRRLVIALRNSLVLYIRRPLFSLGAAALIILLAYLSFRYLYPLLLVLTGSLSAYLANQVTVHVVAELAGDGDAQGSTGE